MGSYFLNFTVYTMAMTGLVFFALFVYKKVMNGSLGAKNSNKLSIEETMSINPRKSLMIVRAGEERFLIASDVDKTTLISKLDKIENIQKNEAFERFENIPQEYEPDIENDFIANINSKLSFEGKKPKLEVIKDKNPLGRELKSFISNEKPPVKTVDINIVGEKQDYGMPTMKEMAKKINEL